MQIREFGGRVGDQKHEVIPATQVVWVVVYWWALLVNGALLLKGVLTPETKLYSIVILALATFAVVLGASFATRIARRGVSDLVFIKGTTTIRTIAVAWLLLGLVIVAVPVLNVFASIDLGDTALADGLLGTVGSLSVLAMIGPGYSDYREALSHARND